MAKKGFKDPVFYLFFFTLFLGVELGSLSKNLEAHGSVVLAGSLLSIENIMWFYFFGLFMYFSYKVKPKMLKTAYMLGGLSFLLTQSVINTIGYKSLYGIKILLLMSATMMLIKHLTEILKPVSDNNNEAVIADNHTQEKK